ncbi:MAG: GTP cyclohydrolase II [Rhodospirillales bacterium]|nr:GTP cyclohydrolase II [Rhodospirillales bacterium]
MSSEFELLPMPATREHFSLLAVDRVISELRRGRIVAVRGYGGAAVLVQAAEATTTEGLLEIAAMSGGVSRIAITARRAAVLGLRDTTAAVVCLTHKKELTAEAIHDLAEPLSATTVKGADLEIHDAETYASESAAVALTKLARLFPAAVVAQPHLTESEDLVAWTSRHDLLLVDAGDVFQYERTAARTLRAVSEARVPLLDAQETRIIAFRPVDGGLEHLAIVIGEPPVDEPVLTRLHSECFTGDLLGSLRCDCGDQLRGAIQEIGKTGSGLLLYLAQEGRGIGLVNKLRAYELQDRGFDTMDANEELGFDADERIYLPAAKMLELLKFNSVRLLTNNPDKVTALSQCGVKVVDRVSHTFPSNEHNELYLRTKAVKSGHSF